MGDGQGRTSPWPPQLCRHSAQATLLTPPLGGLAVALSQNVVPGRWAHWKDRWVPAQSLSLYGYDHISLQRQAMDPVELGPGI